MIYVDKGLVKVEGRADVLMGEFGVIALALAKEFIKDMGEEHTTELFATQMNRVFQLVKEGRN